MNKIKQETGYYNEHFYRIYEPQNEQIKGTILVLHGMQEHSGRYDDFAVFMAENGYIVLSYDHLGHGRTAKTEDDFGFFTTKNSVKTVVNNADKMADFFHQKYANTPHFLLGHSMGSFIARCLLGQSSEKFQGAMIVGTGDKTKIATFSKNVLWAFNSCAPKRKNKYANKLFLKVNNAKFKNENKKDKTRWMSLSVKNRMDFINDKYNGIHFSNNGFYTVLNLQNKATKKKWAKNIPLDFPLFFVSGSDDPIGNFGKGIENIVRKLEKQKFTKVKMKLYPKMRHEILNEDIKEEVYQDILKWMNRI